MTFGVSPKGTPKVTPIVTFWPEKVTFESLFGSESYFWVYFGPDPQKSLLSHFRVTLNFWGLGGQHCLTLRLLNALNSEDRGLKVRFSLAMIVFETFELILCQMLSSQGKNAPSDPYPHYLVRLAASRQLEPLKRR